MQSDISSATSVRLTGMDGALQGNAPAVVTLFAASVLVTIIIHVAFAIAIWRDIGRLRRDGERVWFVWRIVWTLATLMAGLLTVSIYWVMHHSTLARRPAPDSTFS